MASPFVQLSTGGTSGGVWATRTPLHTTGKIWYLNNSNSNASDAAAPRGLDRLRPLSTLSQAYTNAAAGDIIMVGSGHSQSLSASQVLAKAGLMIVGEGTGTSRPRFTHAGGNFWMFDITASFVSIDNIYFPQAAAAVGATFGKVRSSAGVAQMYRSLQFDQGNYDAGIGLQLGVNYSRVHDCGWTSTATATTSQPLVGLDVAASLTTWGSGLVFDGGTYGWSSYALQMAGTETAELYDVSLLNSSRAVYTYASSAVKIHFTAASMSSYLEVA